MTLLPFFSIVIPSYGRASALTQCLDSIARLDYPLERVEVIVVDDGSPAPPTDLRDRDAIRLSLQPHRGPGPARNAGAAQARGDYIVFTADDCLVDSQWLRALAAHADRAPGAAIGGAIRNGLPGDRYATASHLLADYLCATFNADARNGQFFTPNNLAVPADGFRVVGGFDALFTFGAGEDRDFCARWLEHGFRFVHAPEAIVEHRHPQTLSSFVRQHFRYGRGSCLFRQRLRARAAPSRPFEPLAFYSRLLSCPPRRQTQLLMALSQVANACGYARQAWRAAPAPTPHGAERQADN